MICSISESKTLFTSGRWDAEYFQPRYISLQSTLKKNGAVPLGTMATHVARGVAPPYLENGSVPVVRTVNVRELEFSDTRRVFVAASSYDNMPDAQIKPGDLAITSTGVGTLGRVFANVTNDVWFADGHITVVRLKKQELAPYIAAVLQSQIGQWQLEQRQRGSSGQIEIYPEDISAILIPKLSENLMNRIASLWLEAVDYISMARKSYLEAEKELLERLNWEVMQKKSVELSYIVGFNELNKGARVDAEFFQPQYMRLHTYLKKLGGVMLGDLVSSFSRGTQPDGYNDEGEVIVVKSKQVTGRGLELESCERTGITAYADEKAQLKPGDLVINSTGLGTLGRAAVVPRHNSKVVAAVDLVIAHLRKEIIVPDYLALFLNSPAGIAQSEQYQTGSSGQLHLYPQHFAQFMIFLPRNENRHIDIEWQERLAAKVRASGVAQQKARKKLEKVKQLVEDALKSERI